MSAFTGGQPEPRAIRPTGMLDYGISPDPAGLLPWTWALERLESARNYWVCTASPEGRPHAAPVWGVVLNGTLYFSTDLRSVKGRNLTSTGHILVHLESGDEVVMLQGGVEPFQEARAIPDLVERYLEKYGFDVSEMPSDESVWYAVRPTVAHGWRESDFPESATRWEFER